MSKSYYDLNYLASELNITLNLGDNEFREILLMGKCSLVGLMFIAGEFNLV